MNKKTIILGIESSSDETAAAIISENDIRKNKGPIIQNCLGPTDILESPNNAVLNT